MRRKKAKGVPPEGKPLSAHEAGKLAPRVQESPDTARSYAAEKPDPDTLRLASLTEREAEILALMADRKTNREISALLGPELATVKKHLENMYPKLLVKTRAEAVALFLGQQLKASRRENARLQAELARLRSSPGADPA